MSRNIFSVSTQNKRDVRMVFRNLDEYDSSFKFKKFAMITYPGLELVFVMYIGDSFWRRAFYGYAFLGLI